jgi:hypothetical protein
MISFFWKRALYRLFWLLSIIFIGLAIYVGFNLVRDNSYKSSEAKKLVVRKSSQVAEEIEKKLDKFSLLAKSLKNEISDSGHSFSSLKEMLYKKLYMDEDIYEIGLAFKPFVLDSNIRLKGVAFTSKGGRILERDLAAILDYTRPEYTWYQNAIKNGDGWLAPVWDANEQNVFITYAIAVDNQHAIRDKSSPHGVLYLTISASRLRGLLQPLELGEHGYSYVYSKAGRFVIHPKKDYLSNPKIIFKRSEKEIPIQEARMLLKAAEEKLTEIDIIDPSTDQKNWIYFKSLNTMQWQLATVLVYEDILPPSKLKRKQLNFLALFLFLGLISLIIPLVKLLDGSIKSLWLYVLGFSCLALVFMVFIFCVYYFKPDYSNQSHQKITNSATFKKFVVNHDSALLEYGGNLPLYIPTGIYIQSMSFINANDVRLTGYIWQQYTKGLHDSISRGFILPESESVEIEKSYTKQLDDNRELLGWKFRVVLHQKFDYSRFPFGMENVWVQLWHKDFYKNVILAPDLDSYMLTNPGIKPGLRAGLELPGWEIDKTFFSYWTHSYKTNFGLDDYSGLLVFPELYFNTLIRKAFIGPFITYIFPISMIFVMLFTILLLTSREEKKAGILGFNTLGVIGACGGFFLVVIFSHIDLREGLSAKGFIFLEYFYFLTYGAILYVATNAILVTQTQIDFIHTKNNLYMKLAFWPLSMLILLLGTIQNFF